MDGVPRGTTLSRRDRRWLSGIVSSMEVRAGPYWTPRRGYRVWTIHGLLWTTDEIEEGLASAVSARRHLLRESIIIALVVDAVIVAGWLVATVFSSTPPSSPLPALGIATAAVAGGWKLAEAVFGARYLGYVLVPRARDLHDYLAEMYPEDRRRLARVLRGAGYVHTYYLIEHSWSLRNLLKTQGH